MTATWRSALRPVLAAAVVSLSGAALGLHSVHAATLAEIKARGYMIVATEDDYKPFEFMENGKPVGFDNELLAAFRKVVAAPSYKLPAGSGHHAYLWYNLDPLLGHYPGAAGIKTGWTPDAGRCLLFEATLGGLSVIGVELNGSGSGSTVSGSDASSILNWAFEQPDA